MDPNNPDKTVSDTETDDVTISAPDSPPASGANNDANLQGQQQQPQPQQAQGLGQSGQVGGAAALEHPNYNPQQHQQKDGSGDSIGSGYSDGSGDSDSSDDVCFHFSRLLNKIERMLKNRGYAANCRVKRETEEKTLEKRNDKLKHDMKCKMIAIEEATKETELLKRRLSDLNNECEQLKKEHQHFLMKQEEEKGQELGLVHHMKAEETNTD